MEEESNHFQGNREGSLKFKAARKQIKWYWRGTIAVVWNHLIGRSSGHGAQQPSLWLLIVERFIKSDKSMRWDNCRGGGGHSNGWNKKKPCACNRRWLSTFQWQKGITRCCIRNSNFYHYKIEFIKIFRIKLK